MAEPRLFYPRAKAVLQVVLDGFDSGLGSEEQPIAVPVLPKTATIHVNGYQQADSWTLGFDYLDLPFDPQLIRSGAVEIYLYNAAGMDDETAALSRQYAAIRNALKGPDATTGAAVDTGLANSDVFTDGKKPQAAGLFDDESITFDESGKWVKISGQDYTAQLIAKQWPPLENGRARRIPVGQRLDKWAAMILAEADPGGKLQVNLLDIMAEDMPDVGKAEVRHHARGIPVQQNTSYWDVLYKTITRYGYICYIQGLDLVITKPKNLDDIAEHDIKQMGWGANLTSLELTRHLGKEKVPRVVIHSYNDKTKGMLIVEEPDTRPSKLEATMAKTPSKRTTQKETIKSTTAKTGAKKPKTKTETLTDEFVIIPVYGIQDEEALRRAAKMMRTLIGRGERKIIAKTRDLVDAEGTGLLNLTVGAAVAILWQDFNEDVLANQGLTLAARQKYLTDRGFQPEVAKAIAMSYQRLIGKQRPLRLRELTYDYDASSGLDIEMELVDFVMVSGVREELNASARQTLDATLAGIGFSGMGQ